MQLHSAEIRRGHAARFILLNLTAALPMLAGALAASPAIAQTASRDSSAPELEEVIVTATRRAEPLSKIAISVSSFGDDAGAVEMVQEQPG